MTKTTFRSLLQEIVCGRFASRDAALCAIDVAFENATINCREARKLEVALAIATIRDFSAEQLPFGERQVASKIATYLDSMESP